jgi:hypothetical protein
MTIKVTYNVTDVYVTQEVSPVYINVSYSTGGGSGAAVWGSITGTLSDQTDLQTALDGKVPYTGATQDVSLGEYGINVGNVIYDTTPTGIPTDQGATYWDDQAETVALVMNGTIQKIGEDTFYHVKNSTGSTIAKGVAVRFAGSDGASGKILIAPFLANGTYPSQYYMGITAEEIVNGADGKVYHFGKIRGVNTSAFTDGDILYCSTTVAGGFQTAAPSAPNNIVIAAAVINAANNGTLMVRTTTGSNINTDEGVLLTTPTSGEVLKYNGSLWVNDSVSGALGYTPANAATTLTINGVTYDLSTSRTWSVGSISGSGASGQVAYWTGTSSQSGSNNLFWDASNSRLGVGTNTPNSTLSVAGNLNISGGTQDYIFSKRGNVVLTLQSQNSGLLQQTEYYTKDGDGTDDNGFSIFAKGIPSDISNFEQFRYFYSSSLQSYIIGTNKGGTGSDRDIRIGNTLTPTDLVIKATTGNVVINSTSDGGQRLQVQGTTLLNGNVTFSSSTGMTWDATNSRLGIGTNAPSTQFHVSGANAGIYLTRISPNESFILISNTSVTTGGQIRGLGNSVGLRFTNPNSTTEWARFHSTGNFGIGTGATDSGERLQVTGTMKVTGAATISSTNDILTLVGGSVRTTFKMGGTAGGYTEVVGNGTDFYFTTNGNTNISFITNNQDRMRMTGSTGNLLIGTTTDIASSLVTMNSTTKGFLPPRMTTTQKNAISSPAAGLVVYDTTDNKHYGYDGTTWNAFY